MTKTNGNMLFQYRPPTMWALDNLFRRVIFFRSPLEFNDPFDCRTPPALRGLTDRQLALLRRTNPGFWGIPADNDSVSKDEFIAKVNKELREIHGNEIKKCGVACFSKSGDNLLMWSHYAGGGRGFCLAFDNRADLLGKGYDIKYRNANAFPGAYDYVKMLARGKDTDQYPELLLTHKYTDWKYEREVRIIQGKVDEKGYPPEALKAIVLGTNIAESTNLLIRAIIAERYKNIKIIQQTPTNNKSNP